MCFKMIKLLLILTCNDCFHDVGEGDDHEDEEGDHKDDDDEEEGYEDEDEDLSWEDKKKMIMMLKKEMKMEKKKEITKMKTSPGRSSSHFWRVATLTASSLPAATARCWKSSTSWG